MTGEQPALSPQAVTKLNTYLRNGGTILFDTQDQGVGAASSITGGGMRRLRQLAQGLQIGTLAPVPPDHVLTKAFYLMQDFPGRYAGGRSGSSSSTTGSMTGSPRSSSAATTGPGPGRSMPAGAAPTPSCRAASGSARWPIASGSTSSCTR